jgi:methionine biosynthesis protein MetW
MAKREYYKHYPAWRSPEEGLSCSNRPEYMYIEKWVEPKSKVMDLGCGEGSMGEKLIKNKNCEVYGIEISSEGAAQSLRKGLKAETGDIDEGLGRYKDNEFDYTILNQVLYMVYRPGFVLREAVRTGKKTIVSFVNSGNWISRLELLSGRTPRRQLYGFQWYDTKNIRLFTYKDFLAYIRELNLKIAGAKFLGEDSRRETYRARVFPNLFSQVCIMMLEKK